MSAIPSPNRALNLTKVMLGALVYAWTLRAAVLRQAGLAMAAQVLLILVWSMLGGQLPAVAGWVLYVFSLALTAVVAVRCHRLVLLSDAVRDGIAMPVIEKRELKFLLAMFVVWLPASAVMGFSGMLLQTAYLNLGNASAVPDWLMWLAWLPAGYVAGRLSLKLPAAAIDQVMDIASVVSATRGNGWRMCVVSGLIPWLLAMLGSSLYIEDAGPASMLLSCMAMQLLVAVEIMALSIAYRELVGQRNVPAQSDSATPSS